MHAIEEARRLVQSADAFIIAAGAGMSADSGLPTFRGDGGFWKAYPALGQQQLSFTDVASPHTFARDPRLAWGFYGHRLKIYRDPQPHDGYRLLMGLALKANLGAFVVTTNVDGHLSTGISCGLAFRLTRSGRCTDRSTIFSVSSPACRICGRLGRWNRTLIPKHAGTWASYRNARPAMASHDRTS